jgi:hypothetical protein
MEAASVADPSGFSPSEFGSSFKGFLEQMASQTPAEEPFFVRRLREHFGADPLAMPIVGESFPPAERPNLQVALDDYLSGKERSSELLGVASEHAAYMGLSFSMMLAPSRGGLMGGAMTTPGPVKYENLELAEGKILPCLQSGLALLKDGARRLAILFQGSREMGLSKKLGVEVMAPERTEAEHFLGELRTAMRRRNVYRGQLLSLETEGHDRSIKVRFHRLPKIGREQIVLPAGLLDRIERTTVNFSVHANKLLAAGRHLKRGLLLHGPPGTGKTLTAMYLTHRMPDRTVLMVTGTGVGLLEDSCAMARALQPSTVVLEDIDLIAKERTDNNVACGTLLFELLNQMDGLAEDADVLFLLTTNRPDVLEPALAARPGRIDQAIEVPLPDADCRRRLFDLYGRGLSLPSDLESFVARTKGASAAFMRELLRKAALFAADEADTIRVESKHLDAALHELVVEGGSLTRSLLGAQVSQGDRD